ncbi:uncharacterized protein LOC110907800 [Helianthus annuus]|uniref:uncharacterized protein LOC110907800 n=1 Tax=Helianthus annuus TaxID=4232 RepID=UPI000B9032B1|nr:uncharacterized protein LOC110907800 [Helianthus annuus]
METVDHLLCGCVVASSVWSQVSNWCKVSPLILFSVKDVAESAEYSNLGSKAKEAFHGITYVTAWCIWKVRNDKRFSNVEVKVEEIVQSIKSLGYLWYRNQSKDSFHKHPLSIFAYPYPPSTVTVTVVVVVIVVGMVSMVVVALLDRDI